MEINKIKSICDDLNKYDYLAKADSFIEITRWSSGEGWNITINDRIFYLTEGELDAINYLVNTIRFEKDKP